MTNKPAILIELEVAYAKQDAQALLPIKAAPEITARQAIEISGILKLFPEIDLTVMDIGI